MKRLIILFFLTLTLTSAAPQKNYYQNGALKSEIIEQKITPNYPTDTHYISLQSANRRAFSPAYVKNIIQNGSNRLMYPNKMPAIALKKRQLQEIIAFVSSSMQGRAPRSFSKCSGCHGPKGDGISNIAPALYRYYTKAYYEYYPNGNRKLEASLIHNSFQGEVRYYYKSGALQSRVNYDDGRVEGIVQEFFPNGSLKSRVAFRDNHAVKGLKYNEEGFKKRMKRDELRRLDAIYSMTR